MPDTAAGLRDRLTVVLLTYNCAHRITTVVQRLLELDVAIVAVDNASSDATADVLRTFAGVEVVELPRNIGAAGRNVGAERARTPYVAFCDDDGWYERAGLDIACDLFDDNPQLGLINARILVRDEQRLDPISVEMADSPVPDRYGLPGAVLLSFMAGAAVVRAVAYRAAGGYDERFFMGGEEETLAFPLAKLGWQMRYIPDVVMHHYPSLANATTLRAYGMRNTLVNAWLHRPLPSALRWTVFTLADTPKNWDYARGVLMTLRAAAWIVRERAPMNADLDADVALLDARRYAARRPLLHTQAWQPPPLTHPAPPA
jgi:GT2 family glycosyltransferase